MFNVGSLRIFTGFLVNPTFTEGGGVVVGVSWLLLLFLKGRFLVFSELFWWHFLLLGLVYIICWGGG